MNYLPVEKQVSILRCLFNGMSIRATAGLADVSPVTVLKLIRDAGHAAYTYQDQALRNLPCQRIQVDEIWSFVYAKAKNVGQAHNAPPSAGDVWTWVALDADSKLVITWLVGDRSTASAVKFLRDLRPRLTQRIQLTTDGYSGYLEAVDAIFGRENVDYATLVKEYERRQQTGEDSQRVYGSPDPAHISTSYVERQNLTLRMSLRRYTRRTNAFSKKIEYHIQSVSLHYLYYNFCRKHLGLGKKTPAMVAGVADHVWELEELCALVQQDRLAKL